MQTVPLIECECLQLGFTYSQLQLEEEEEEEDESEDMVGGIVLPSEVGRYFLILSR